MSRKKIIVICAAVAILFGLVAINKLNIGFAQSNTSKQTSLGTQTKVVLPPKTIKAFDSANTINDAVWFKKAYAAGFRLYVLDTTLSGTCTPWSRAQPQIKMALAARLKVAAYTRNPNCWHNGILSTGTYSKQLQFFALDVESDPGIPVTRAMVNGVKALGVRPVIYNNAGSWPTIQGASANSFSDLPLWESNESSFAYNKWRVDYLLPKPVKYGGWNTKSNMRVGVQQQLEYKLNGINVDLNSFNANFIR